MNIILTARQNVVNKALFTPSEVLVSSNSYWEAENTTFNASNSQCCNSHVSYEEKYPPQTHTKTFSYYVRSYKSNCAFTILHYSLLTTLLASPNSEMIFIRITHILVACNRTSTGPSHMDSVQLPMHSLDDGSIVPEHYA